MNKSEIIINGVPFKAGKLKTGDVELYFKIPTFDNKFSLYKVLVRREYWKSAVIDMKDANYFTIKGAMKAVVNSKGVPFISVMANSIKIFHFKKNEDGEIDLNYEIPEETEEIIDIGDIINDPTNVSGERAKNKEIKYIKNNSKFSKPIVIDKETKVIKDGFDQYAAAKELGITNVPIKYI